MTTNLGSNLTGMRQRLPIGRVLLFCTKAAIALLGIFHLVTADLRAQSVTVGYGSGRIGSIIDIDLSFSAGATGITALSIDLNFSSTLTFSSVSAGSPGTVTFRFLSDDARLIGERSAPIAANGKIRIDDPSFFIPVKSDTPLAQGYLEILSDGVRLTGSVVFGGASAQSFAAALPLVSTLQNSVLISHLASNDTFFTGIAITNPNDSNALATMDIYSADGQLEFRSLAVIPARQRRSRLMTEYFPILKELNRSSGYIRVSADKPIASFAVFGTLNLRVLSAIPPQPVP